jgi:hypothetical protein
MGLVIEFCGERHSVQSGMTFTIGREADLSVDDNPYLHRRFLAISGDGVLWWIANVGSRLSATFADHDGGLQAWLSPGARVPIVFPASSVWFTAGPTTYEIDLLLDESPFAAAGDVFDDPDDGDTTIGRVSLTPDQRMLLVALAEPVLRTRGRKSVDIPSSAAAADRLGWTVTKFNRKLDNVCQKLESLGIQGLHGEPGRLASDRKARLVEFAVATRIVGADDLLLLGQT